MDKIIGIGALNENTRQFYEGTLREILGDKFTIKSYNFNRYNTGVLDVDVLLISTPLMINIVKEFLHKDTRLIVMSRTFTKEAYDILKTIPKGTKALLVNNGIDTTFETISLIYSLGFEFELYPHYPGVEEREHIEVAITTNEEKIVPKHIKKTYNIGHMVYTMSTMVDLLSEFDLDDGEKDNILYKYQKRIIPQERGVNTLIGNNTIIKTSMHTILDLINDGVIETDKAGNIITLNKKGESLLRIEEKDVVGKNIKDIINIDIRKTDSNEEIENLLINYKKENLVINLKPLKVFNNKVGNIITIEDVTELRKLEEQVRREIAIKGYEAKYTLDNIIGNSERIRETKKIAQKMASSNASVLIVGETGTGKELFAQAIHNSSKRKNYPFVAINCAALPENLIESELFGYEGGAFTGARKEGKAGVFEEAHLGTLFLDEIGDLQLSMQARLLRVLQEGEVVRIGSNKIRKVDVRIISATNRDLHKLAEEGKFRWDLYYRLNIFPLRIPSLRERKEDIEIIFNYFIKRFKSNKKVSQEVIDILKNHRWQGNIRELRNLAKYLSEMGSDPMVKEDLPYTFVNENLDRGEISKEEIEILKIIYEHMIEKKKIGRNKISLLLEKRNIFLTEREVRTILNNLSEKGYVQIGIGRQGTKLTEKGIELIT